MTEEKENSLRSRGNLFQEPDSTLLLSSGCGMYFLHCLNPMNRLEFRLQVATGQMPVVSSTTTTKTFSSGSMKKIK